jgi:hypothetical protein
MKRTLIKVIAMSVVFTIGKVEAASVLFDTSLFAVRDKDGVTLVNSTPFYAAYGWFTGGFAPTLANYSSWMSNFKGASGYHQTAGGGLNTVSASITLIPVSGPGNDPDFGVYVNDATVASSQGGTLLNLSVGETLPRNQQFSVILWNATDPGSATQAAILTNNSGPSWRITTQFDVAAPELVDVLASPSGMVSTFGTSDTTAGNRFIQMALVPEPSTGALMMVGAAGLVALRRLRKV